jgi:hypothetical protein
MACPTCSKQLLCALTLLPATIQGPTLSNAMVRRLTRLPFDDEAIALRLVIVFYLRAMLGI